MLANVTRPVGVGGYILGGGVSYYLSARGWGANYLVNVELVNAQGDVIQVNATSYPDLFWSLKGGSNNFGIATRYDLETFPLVDVYGGFLTSNETYVNDVVQGKV
jgi:FAD/FMN-containing dehydrogenase